MATNEKNIMLRSYLFAGGLFLFAAAIVFKLVTLQTTEGTTYRDMADATNEKMFTIDPARGNLYADDGSLLATSVAKYEIHFDANIVKESLFTDHVEALADSLGAMLGKPASHYLLLLEKARKNRNGYQLIARNLGYSEYLRIKSFPIFKEGKIKGGFIPEFKTVREHPLGKIAERTVGSERLNENGKYVPVGLEGAFGDYLRGTAGKRLKQRIQNGKWKPIGQENIIEPKDGYDVVSTINVGIQDIAHHALLKQLEKYNADHGCAVVMEVSTGEIKAISNLGRNKEGKYYERLNYAVGESHEPGSTFKLMSMVAALEDKVVDTNTVLDTEKGRWRVYDRVVKDSKIGGYGQVTASKGFEVSSNVALAKIVYNGYQNQPEKFVERLMSMGLHQDLELPIKGEGQPIIRYPGDKGWSGISLAWMSFGYEVSMTPMQTLAFYNAIANDGEMIRPRLIKEVRELNNTIHTFDKEIINPSICSEATLGKVQHMLKNVVETKHGTGRGLYTPYFSMAGKTGTCQKNYAPKDEEHFAYISSFAGYFPADNPKYSCIVVIHDPDKSVGYYGADVSGPVFKSIAHKVFASSPVKDALPLQGEDENLEKAFGNFYDHSNKEYATLPNVKGMSGMDAIALLENLGLKVVVKGNGKVKKQSVAKGTALTKVDQVVLELL
ncbi:penicillin-binding protein [Sediminicola luteus]|uniref:Penicillin-binding protein n=1 Tax=Sediminicola luteus TaxID=319238 RepID=A0A2A4G4N2_9FLAO|nr:penicillin-binding protein [Sediminicola luteus]PCE63391.1 penicillin-binding protein [Sediminicola luteus]